MQPKQIRPQERDLRNEVYQCQMERGLVALVKLLEYRREQALTNLRHARGTEELVRWQTAFNEAQNTIDSIKIQPVQFTKPE